MSAASVSSPAWAAADAVAHASNGFSVGVTENPSGADMDRVTFPLSMDRFARAFAVYNPESVRVQVQKRGEVLCGSPVDFVEVEGGATLFKVLTVCGPVWVHESKTRVCSGVDGRCSCVGEVACGGGDAAGSAPSGTAAATPLQVVPLGNTGRTMPEGVQRV